MYSYLELKLGARRAHKAKFCGYSNTYLLFPNYFVIPYENGQYGRIRESKDVIFDPTIDFSIYTNDEEPYRSLCTVLTSTVSTR